MYNALLSYGQIQQYLLLSIAKDLLQYDDTANTFNITEKGIRFLEIYNKLDQAMNGRGEEKFVCSIIICIAVKVLKIYILPTTIREEMDAVFLLLLAAFLGGVELTP
jgi:hypothetical protein